MTKANLTPSELLGKHVTFFVDLLGQKILHRGIVQSVCLNLDGDHEILLEKDFYTLSSIENLKITGVPCLA